MAQAFPLISIIIPTHNRQASLLRLLSGLAQQSYPLQCMEVVVVADGCKDGTVTMLQAYAAPYKLHFLERPGQGAAMARNAGAATATCDFFLFLDDDIEPSPGMVEAHVRAHEVANRVVIGYLPFPLAQKPDFWHIQLWSWWEGKFQAMRAPGYRYNYEDLLSGNFSLSAGLFNQLHGFDTSFLCHEDYELGNRLIRAGAQFYFCKEAWGVHRDEVTDLKRSLGRKRQEGKADVQLSFIRPELIPRLKLRHLAYPQRRLDSAILFSAFHAATIGDGVARALFHLMGYGERIRARNRWQRLSVRLHDYWYLRGLADNLKSRTNLRQLVQSAPSWSATSDELSVDLKAGLTEAEALLDQKRPESALLYYGEHLVGSLPGVYGAERLRGAHLRPILATRLSKSYSAVLALESALGTHEKSTACLASLPV